MDSQDKQVMTLEVAASQVKDATNSFTERLGVSAVEHQCCRIHWIFRERLHTDFGIDADIEETRATSEITETDGKQTIVTRYTPTGRHISVQVKSGQSYTSSAKGNYTLQVTAWDASLWLLSDRPVIVVMYDDVEDEIRWEQVTRDKLNKIEHRSPDGFHKYEYTIKISRQFNDTTGNELSDLISNYVHPIVNQYSPSVLNLEYLTAISGDISSMHSYFRDVRKSKLSYIKEALFRFDFQSATAQVEYLRLEILNRTLLDRVMHRDVYTQLRMIDNEQREKEYFECVNKLAFTACLFMASLDSLSNLLDKMKSNFPDLLFRRVVDQTLSCIKDYYTEYNEACGEYCKLAEISIDDISTRVNEHLAKDGLL